MTSHSDRRREPRNIERGMTEEEEICWKREIDETNKRDEERRMDKTIESMSNMTTEVAGITQHHLIQPKIS